MFAARVVSSLAVLLLAAKFGVPVCPHAGGVGLCEYVQHLSMIDYLCIAGTREGRVIEFVDHLHEHFKEPCVIEGAAYMPPKGVEVPAHLLDKVHVYTVPWQDENGEFIVDNIDGQDIMAWVTQGAIADRTAEHLGASDKGVAMYRRVLKREMQKVADGQDPMGLLRDPARNVRIELPTERKKHHNSDGFAAFTNHRPAYGVTSCDLDDDGDAVAVSSGVARGEHVYVEFLYNTLPGPARRAVRAVSRLRSRPTQRFSPRPSRRALRRNSQVLSSATAV